MNSFIFLRNKSRWLLLFVWTNSRKLLTSKIKIIYVNNSLHVCVKTKRNIPRNVFSQSGTEIMWTYPIRKHLWNIIKFYMYIQFISRPSRNLLEGERLLVAVMKQWNGEKLEINFHWIRIFMIFMMGMNKAHGLLSFDLNLPRFCQT